MVILSKSGSSGMMTLFILFCAPIIIMFIVVSGFLMLLNPGQPPAPENLLEETYGKSAGFPKVAEKFYPIYKSAEKKYGVPWNILAGIHRIETNFSQNLNTSSVGATGHTQFMDKTWVGWSYPGGTKLGDLPNSVDITDLNLIAKYGGLGVDANGNGKADPMEAEDAIHASAKYLASNHSPGEDWFASRGPVYNYNHDYLNYVLPVKRFSESFAVVLPGNGLPVNASGKFLWPTEGGSLSSPFRPPHRPDHNGIDIAASLGTPIKAADGGVVIRSGPAGGYGWLIIIDHKNGYYTRYAHMYQHSVFVDTDQRKNVKKGQMIAKVGSNGKSTGPHLHFEIMRNNPNSGFINPAPLVKGGIGVGVQ